MMNTEKILEQFHYFNINSEIDSVYGNWAVSADGDVVNFLYSYAILSIHINDCDWVEKMQGKVWFKPEYEDNLRRAIIKARQLNGNKS